MRLLIRFSKIDNAKYISHLDLQQIFIHAFNRSGYNLKYSQGFNPHPKIIFASPLSLGFISNAEYLEVKVDEKNDTSVDKTYLLARELTNYLPNGIKILYIREIKNDKNSIATLPFSSEYKILINANYKNISNSFDLIKSFNEFISNENLEIRKIRKKTGKEKITPVLQNIISINIDKAKATDLFLFDYADIAYRFSNIESNFFTINANLKSNSEGNLNPKDLIELFIEKNKFDFDYEIMRTNIFTKYKGNLVRFDKSQIFSKF